MLQELRAEEEDTITGVTVQPRLFITWKYLSNGLLLRGLQQRSPGGANCRRLLTNPFLWLLNDGVITAGGAHGETRHNSAGTGWKINVFNAPGHREESTGKII